MKGFLGINTVLLPMACLEQAYDHMRKMGVEGFEGVALFAGKELGQSFRIERALIPKQVAVSIEYGLLYSVPGDELHRLNVFLYENELSLIAQIHSHPKEAFHSETDDAYPIVTTAGGLSIVVPDFALGTITPEKWATYRLSEEGEWKSLSQEDQRRLIIIE